MDDRVRTPVAAASDSISGRRIEAFVHLLVPFQVALVTGRVVALPADVVLLPAMHRQMALQERLPAEVPPAVAAHVAVVVEDEHVITQRCLVFEGYAATFQTLVALLVHGQHVTFQIVLPVGQISTLRTTE